MKHKMVWSFLIIASASLFFYSCSGSGVNTVNKTAAKPGAAVHYSGLFLDAEGLKAFNDSETIPLCKASAVEKVVPSPSGSALAFLVIDTVEQSTAVYSYDLSSRTCKSQKEINEKTSVNLFWEDDSLLYVNCVETKPGRSAKQKPSFSGTTELVNILDGSVSKKIKPARGAVLEAVIPEKYFIYSDPDGVYILDKNKNRLVKTLKGFSSQNLKGLKFSPDGKKIAFFEPKKVADQFGTTHPRNELYIANFDGTKEQKIINFTYDPQNAAWSPASATLLCDVISQDWGNLRHAAQYEVSAGKVIFNTEEEGGFVPNLSACAWAPSGNQYIVKKTIQSQVYRETGYIIHDVESGKGYALKDTAGKNLDFNTLGTFITWCGDNIVLFGNQEKDFAYTIAAKTYTIFPKGRQIIYVWEEN
jgi:translation elongation factor P/translation initiation factor 5A